MSALETILVQEKHPDAKTLTDLLNVLAVLDSVMVEELCAPTLTSVATI